MTALRVALVGTPNCGKTALFNLLTGSRQKVANYPGVTVERKHGECRLPDGSTIDVIDLPGTYSFHAASPDEAVTRDVCIGRFAGETRPDVLVCVVDATNLRLHLRFALEVQQLGRPTIFVLNMSDEAERRGIHIDRDQLAALLAAPLVSTVAVRRNGASELLERLARGIPAAGETASGRSDDDLHRRVAQLLEAAVTMPRRTAEIDDVLDGWVLHPVWGGLILTAVLFLMFQAVFAWAQPMMDGIGWGFTLLSGAVEHLLPAGLLRSLLAQGIIPGVSAVVVFLPQILILFAFILILEESGYLPRAAYLLDPFMVGAGLSGRAFIPLLSSFACAVPGIMATRSIQNPRDRLLTIIVAPLMTCSARLPVYTLLIGAFIPQRLVAGWINLQGLVLFSLYAAGIIAALLVATVVKKTGTQTAQTTLLLELPSYRMPNPRDIAIGLWERANIFLFERVGKIIVAVSVVLWFLESFPAPPAGAHGIAIGYSFAGRIGHLLQPLFAPLGFSWQMCVSLIPGMAAREVVIGALATTYALSVGDGEAAQKLAPIIASQWSLATALSLLVWYVFSPQCISTLAIIRRETNSWKITAGIAGYLTVLAYLCAWITYIVALHFTRHA